MNARQAHALHVHVKRLVVDAAALDGASPESLRTEVMAALQQDLGAESAQLQVGRLASHIGAAVTPAITAQLPASLARDNGGARHG